MTLRKKTLFVIGGMFFGVIVIVFFVTRSILLKDFAELGHNTAHQNVERMLGTLADDVSSLEAITGA